MSKDKNKMQAGFSQAATLSLPRELKEFWRGFFAHLRGSFIPHHTNNYHPEVFSQRMTALLSVLLVCVKLFTVAALSLGPALPAYSSDLSPANIISLTNASRQSFGLKPLAESASLDQAALAKAQDMLEHQYFAHNSPQGKTPWDFIRATGYQYLVAGENLAVNFTDAESVEQAWMDSPSHKANLLNKNYEEIGIGILSGQYQGRSATFVVQMFGSPSEQPVTLTSVPTRVETQTVPEPKAALQPEALGVAEAQVLPDGELMQVTAKTTGQPIKVLARFKDRAIMLDPTADGGWSGYVPVADLAGSGSQLVVTAQDINGLKQDFKVAYFSSSVAENYNVLGAAYKPQPVNLFGAPFVPKTAETNFYLWFAVSMLASLVLAIGIRHRIQHPSLVMNGSLVVVLAMILWLAG